MAMYLIFMVLVVVFITSFSLTLIDGMGRFFYVENLVRVLLNFFAIILFARGLCNPEVYDRRSEPRIACFLMQIDTIIGFSLVILDFFDIWTVLWQSTLTLSTYTWFAILCYHWQIDDRRRNALQIGVPIHSLEKGRGY